MTCATNYATGKDDVRPETREVIKGLLILVVFFTIMALKERFW